MLVCTRGLETVLFIQCLSVIGVDLDLVLVRKDGFSMLLNKLNK